MKRTLVLSSLPFILAIGCGGDNDSTDDRDAGRLGADASTTPVDAEGTYSVNLTNGPNGCDIDDWTVGESQMAVPVVVTQTGATFTAEVQGLPAVALQLQLRSSTFEGSVTGNALRATLTGAPESQDDCAFTPNVELVGTLSGDILTGTLRWYYDTNSSPDCGARATCSSTQELNGARPPR